MLQISWARTEGNSDGYFAEQSSQVKRPGEHRKLAVRGPRPLVPRLVAIQLDSIVIRVAQINRLADAVIRCPVKLYSCRSTLCSASAREARVG